ncbi:mannose-1-phosphate guanylyltransferase [Candidatus Parcubacteria bacterium]|nr:mannose-1-phosphate guanylyltransferase [Candidatus Parcubacteria bacterium]
MLNPIIIAGGQGTRLWPISRKGEPKQIKPFLNGKTLLKKTYERLLVNIPGENIFLSTTKLLRDAVKKEMEGLPEENIIIEPEPRGTAAALGLSLFRILKKDKDAIFVYINSDNFIKDEKEYHETLSVGEKIVLENPGKVLLIGVKPDCPETGYGYIKVGENAGKIDEHKFYSVKKFVEKPNLETAKQFLESGEYFWNPTLIIARADYFLSLYKKHLPDMYDKLLEITESPEKIERIFPTIEAMSIDCGILEKESNMLVLPADFGWMDIGHWKAIWDMHALGIDDNIEIGRHIHLDSRGNLIYSDKLVATIGLENMLIIDSHDALLVCPKDRAQDVKKIVEKFKEKNKEEYL